MNEYKIMCLEADIENMKEDLSWRSIDEIPKNGEKILACLASAVDPYATDYCVIRWQKNMNEGWVDGFFSNPLGLWHPVKWKPLEIS
jgi:hypothetical protein